MDIYLTGHLALAFAKSTNQSIIQINQANQFIHLYNPSLFFVLGLKQKNPPKKISEIFLPYLFCPSCP